MVSFLFVISLALFYSLTSARTYGLLSTERPKITFIPYSPEQRIQVAHQAQDLFTVYCM